MDENNITTQSNVDPHQVTSVTKQVEGTINRRGRVILTAILIALLLFILLGFAALVLFTGGLNLGGTIQGDGLTWIRSIYGPAPGDLHNPQSVFPIGSGGTFWVADGDKFRLIEYDIAGKAQRIVTEDTAGDPIIYPTAVTVAPDGTTYIAQLTYQSVRAFDQSFNLLQKLEVYHPNSLVADNDVLVVGVDDGYQVFDRSGQFIAHVGEWGREEVGLFDRVHGLAFDREHNLYVLDMFNNRVYKFDVNGDLLWSEVLGMPANSGVQEYIERDMTAIAEQYPANLQTPAGITIDGAGRVVVIDSLDFSIAAFDPSDGSFIGKWGTFGVEDGHLFYPNDIAYDASADVFIVAEPTMNRVQIFKIPGSGGNLLTDVRSTLGDLLSACCWPLLILLAIILGALILRRLIKTRETKDVDVTPSELIELDVEDTEVVLND
jgi:DNA-binding beta-propeller fold protein YncE